MKALLLIAGLLLGCGSTPLGEPTLTLFKYGAQLPYKFIQGDATISGDVRGPLPGRVDFNAGTARVDTAATLNIGERAFPASIGSQHTLGVVLPDDFPLGSFPVALVLADGRVAKADQPFEVTATPYPDAYAFDPIGDHKVSESFSVVIRAIGPSAALFDGEVRMTASDGSFASGTLQSFKAGVAKDQVSWFAPTTAPVTLTVTDRLGRSATSNPFNIAP